MKPSVAIMLLLTILLIVVVVRAVQQRCKNRWSGAIYGKVPEDRRNWSQQFMESLRK
jgi:hypothetical protein